VLAVLSLCSCNNKQEGSLIPEEVNSKALSLLDTNKHNLAGEVSFANKKLFCLQADRFAEKNERLAVMVASVNDTTIVCRLYAYKQGQWAPQGKDQAMYIDSLDKSAFSIRYDDFNFDGHKDVVFNFKKDKGTNGYGYLVTYTPGKGLELHPETYAIANMKADPASKNIVAVVHPAEEDAKTQPVTSIYRWKEGKLTLIEEKK
jgi:hypothetical protein